MCPFKALQDYATEMLSCASQGGRIRQHQSGKIGLVGAEFENHLCQPEAMPLGRKISKYARHSGFGVGRIGLGSGCKFHRSGAYFLIPMLTIK